MSPGISCSSCFLRDLRATFASSAVKGFHFYILTLAFPSCTFVSLVVKAFPCVPPCPPWLRFLVDRPTLHHEIAFLHHRHIRQRIPRHGHDVRELAHFNRSNFVLHPQ